MMNSHQGPMALSNMSFFGPSLVILGLWWFDDENSFLNNFPSFILGICEFSIDLWLIFRALLN